MPRPGPRPYECVRRAWHSDRHKPMRGFLIREIFRVVNEIHSSATKKNREWQEKLPVVVIKAEEIMYSKANSEEEYMDIETLFDRTNDAIDTIIRRDESSESGELLQPCIEAALNLGCIPRRASRSQRHSNPRCYLTPNPKTQEPTSISPSITDNTVHRSSPHNSQFILPYSTHLGSESCTLTSQEKKPIKDFPFTCENFPPLSNFGCVYPLYYGTQIQTKETHLSFQNTQETLNPKKVFVGTPVNPSETGILRNLFSIEGATNVSNGVTVKDYIDTSENPPEIECDLSLRLGLVSASSMSSERSWVHEVEDDDSSSSHEGSKFFDQSVRKDKGLCFFPDEHLEPCPTPSKLRSEVEGLMVEVAINKRKKPPTNSSEDGFFCLKSKISSNHFVGGMKKTGL